MATYVILEDAPDGGSQLVSRSSTWSNARAGTDSMTVNSFYAALQSVRQASFSPFQWAVAQRFVSFDASSVTDDVVSIAMRVRLHDTQRSGYQIAVREVSDWGTLDGSDFVPGASLSSMSLATTFTPSSTGSMPISLPPSALSSSMRFLLHDTLQQQSSTPTPLIDNSIGSGGVGFRYSLIVHTVQPSTLMGVHDAAVQLSDGSTVYLEANGVDSEAILKHVSVAGVVTTIGGPYFPGGSASGSGNELNRQTVVADGNDRVYWFQMAGASYAECNAYEHDGSGWSWVAGGYLDNGGTQIAATYCDAGNGTNGKGRILAAITRTDGSFLYFLWNCGDITSGFPRLDNPNNYVDTGTNPSWLVSSSAYRNTSGTGLSLATDVFGGTRVGVFSASNNALTSTSGTVTYQTRISKITVGSSITNVSTTQINNAYRFGAANVDGFVSYRAKMLGIGSNTFACAWTGTLDEWIVLWTDGDGAFPNNHIMFGWQSGVARFFDAVYDPGTEAVWVYYWNESDNTKLMRRPYFPATTSLGTAEEVTTDATGGVTRDFIRTVKHLRDSRFVEVHYNRSA